VRSAEALAMIGWLGIATVMLVSVLLMRIDGRDASGNDGGADERDWRRA
jgi:hypothetical protein